MPTAKKAVDLDAKYAARIQANLKARKTYPIDIFGREWHVTDGQAVAQIMDAVSDETGQGFIDLCVAMLVDEEQADFRAQLHQPGIDAEILLGLLDDLMQVASGGRPTEPSDASSTTSRTTKSGGRSRVS